MGGGGDRSLVIAVNATPQGIPSPPPMDTETFVASLATMATPSGLAGPAPGREHPRRWRSESAWWFLLLACGVLLVLDTLCLQSPVPPGAAGMSAATDRLRQELETILRRVRRRWRLRRALLGAVGVLLAAGACASASPPRSPWMPGASRRRRWSSPGAVGYALFAVTLALCIGVPDLPAGERSVHRPLRGRA